MPVIRIRTYPRPVLEHNTNAGIIDLSRIVFCRQSNGCPESLILAVHIKRVGFKLKFCRYRQHVNLRLDTGRTALVIGDFQRYGIFPNVIIDMRRLALVGIAAGCGQA